MVEPPTIWPNALIAVGSATPPPSVPMSTSVLVSAAFVMRNERLASAAGA